MFFVIAPSIAVAIAYAAWRGKPKSFDREMYWTVFVATCAVAAVIIVYSLRMQTDDEMRFHLVQLVCLGLGALLFGVSFGFGVGVFTRRSTSVTESSESKPSYPLHR